MARPRNHRHPHHQTGYLHHCATVSFPSDVHRLRPEPPPGYNHAYFPPHYLQYSRPAPPQNAARFSYLHQESIHSLYDQRFCPLPRFTHTNNETLLEDETVFLNILDPSVPRFQRRRNRSIGFSHPHSVLLDDETLILDLSDQSMIHDHRGVSEKTTVKYMKTRVSRAADNDEVCVVCQVNLFQENQKIATLHCGHEYHAKCIKKWLNVKNNCPLCKATGLM